MQKYNNLVSKFCKETTVSFSLSWHSYKVAEDCCSPSDRLVNFWTTYSMNRVKAITDLHFTSFNNAGAFGLFRESSPEPPNENIHLVTVLV